MNIDEIKPSFEELDDNNKNINSKQSLKEKKKCREIKNFSSCFNWP